MKRPKRPPSADLALVLLAHAAALARRGAGRDRENEVSEPVRWLEIAHGRHGGAAP